MFTKKALSILRDKLGRRGDSMEHSDLLTHNIRYEGLPREGGGGMHIVVSVSM